VRFARRDWLACLTATACCSALLAGQAPPSISAGRAAAQVGVGVIATPVGFIGGGLAARWLAGHVLGAPDDGGTLAGTIGGYTGGVLLTAVAPVIIGPGPHASGNYAAAVAGSIAGGVGSFLLIRLNRAVDLGTIPRLLGAVVVFALPASGAAAGYDLSRRRR